MTLLKSVILYLSWHLKSVIFWHFPCSENEPTPMVTPPPPQSRKTRAKLFDSTMTTLQNKNLPIPFSWHSSLNFLPPLSYPLFHLDSLATLQQASTLATRQPRLSAPNLTHSEKPLPCSTMTPLSLPLSSSTEMLKDLDSTTNQHHPVFFACRYKL